MKWLKILKVAVKVGGAVASVAVKNPQNAQLRDKVREIADKAVDALESKNEGKKDVR